MGKKKAPQNPFYCFMVELKERNPQKYTNMQQASIAAGQQWERMTPEQKRPYEERSRCLKGKQAEIKYTSTGYNLALIEKQEQEEQMRDQQMRDTIEELVKSSQLSGELVDTTFNFIHLNYFCLYNCNRNKKSFVPAEVGICKFTLRDGVHPDNVYHSIIEPVRIPVGYAADAKRHSSETHKIQPPLVPGEGNLSEVLGAILSFIEEPHYSKIRLYCREQDMESVEDMLLFLTKETGYTFEFELFSIEYLAYQMRNNISDRKWPSFNVCKTFFGQDRFAFCHEIACKYHQEMEVYMHCSRSWVVRMAYMICDHCCVPLGLTLEAGVHMPRKATMKNDNLFRSRSVMSLASSIDYKFDDSASERCPSRMSQSSCLTNMTTDSHFEDDFEDDSDFDVTVSAGNFRSLSQLSSGSFQECRRPGVLSLGLTGSQQASTSSGQGHFPGLTRGRGRRIAANFNNDLNH